MRGRTLFVACLVALSPALALGQSAFSFERASGQSGLDFVVGTSPLAVATADLNDDGKVDIVTANNDSGDVSVLLGQGDGTFLDPGASFPVGVPDISAPSAVAIGDFNGDGKPDIIATDEIGDTVSVLLNQGGAVFATAIVTDTGSSPEAVAVGDFNGDGKLDAATADNLDDTVTVLIGTGDGHFAAGVPISVGIAPLGLAAADLDGDGKLDLVVTNSASGPQALGTLTVLKGNGDGTFTAQPEISSTTFNVPVAITVADLNGDAKPDLVVANEEGDSISVLLSTGDLTFPNSMGYDVGSLPEGAAVADFNNDGKPDIATANLFDDNVSVLAGVGDGTFLAASEFAVGTSPSAIASADFNNDGLPDITTANTDDDTVSALLNTTSSTPVCVGDCHGTGTPAVNDIITLVNIVLGAQPASACASGIPSGETANVALIIQAVNNVLNGCPQS